MRKKRPAIDYAALQAAQADSRAVFHEPPLPSAEVTSGGAPSLQGR